MPNLVLLQSILLAKPDGTGVIELYMIFVSQIIISEILLMFSEIQMLLSEMQIIYSEIPLALSKN